MIPRLKGPEAVLQLIDLSSDISEAYQTVRASVELSSEKRRAKTLAITSSRAGEGKSTTALAMARDAAAAGRKVLLIDADMRRPSVHKMLGLQKIPGLSNMLTQQMPASAVIHATETENLVRDAGRPQAAEPGRAPGRSRLSARC